MKAIEQIYAGLTSITKLKPDEKFVEFDEIGNQKGESGVSFYTSDDLDKDEFSLKDGSKSLSYMLHLLELAEKEEINKATRSIRDKYTCEKKRLQKPLEILKAKLLLGDDYDIVKKVKQETSEASSET